MNEPNNIDLDKMISVNESWGHLGAWAVIVGLVLEVVLAAVFHQGKSDLENWAPVSADVLVALGVWAEVHFNGKASEAQKEKQRVSDERIAEANERAAKLEKEAADARERTSRIEQLTAWRRISPEQESKLVEALGEIAPSLRLFLEHQNGDPEAFTYAIDIAQALTTAGLSNPIGLIPNLWMHGGLFGASISVSSGLDVKAILAGFEAAGVSFMVKEWDSLRLWPIPQTEPRPNVAIAIYPKPPPNFSTADSTVC